ncbi:hypothetical protein C1637_02355 [Chryseobacterium lactis]|uniref:Uncharacterized protein n=1 Tax=Chryseobacterium lactis TaxID=1241981 RepID=A0A3G6RRG1_CHRLC|nr:hypothetical protein [Chryseobacterium lactis]AZA81434.1 hypothetical protein EG342_05740 [Chryseobacterium lactis]AZB06433.1 hypothetical protein EG341_21865 [Chryseobacterium lactis]PNW15285.1 hypothetical protein C1637_02355 [Chryseobacterium lactis]
MIKKTTRFSIFVFLFLGILAFSQEKKKFSSIPNVLQQIEPNDRVDSWVLVYNSYGKGQEIKTSGGKLSYTPQFSGFNLFPTEDSFYYIAYSQGGKINYVIDVEALKKFVGKIDNAQEAAIVLAADGYIVDEEFKDLAGNYHEDRSNYYLDLGKLTSKECPYQKTHYTLTINKATGITTNVKDNGTYIELYNKKCANNPRLLKIEKKEEPKKDEPKKTTKRK